MNRSGDSRPVLVRKCTPGLILAVSFGLFLIAGGSAVAQGNGTAPAASSLLPGVREDYVDSRGVRIHCVSLGREGSPLLVLIHGFPDFWYSWRAQMPALARDFHVVASRQSPTTFLHHGVRHGDRAVEPLKDGERSGGVQRDQAATV